MTATIEPPVNKTTIRPFTISRVFDVSHDLVWQAWAESQRLMQWFGPKSFTMPAAKLVVRPAGMFHYYLCATDGKEMWGKFVYREIVASERIVLVNSFSDEDGGLTRHPTAPSWPGIWQNIERKIMQKITPFLWFHDNAEEAVKFYTSIFKNSKITTIPQAA